HHRSHVVRSSRSPRPTAAPRRHRPVHHRVTRRVRRPVRAAVVKAPASTCAPNALRGVYHPYRLEVLGACRRYVGTVIAVRHEDDGDYHVIVSPDHGYAGYLDGGNYSQQHGGIVAEIMPGQHLETPFVGGHLVLV